MRKRRKSLIVVALIALLSIALIALCFAPSGHLLNEPEYQGRYLSEWLSSPHVLYPDLESADKVAKAAVLAIGTNALPIYLDWLRYEKGPLRQSLGSSRIHRWLANTPAYSNWLNPPEQWRALYAFRGFEILGTNAVGAIPTLSKMLNDTTNQHTCQRALGVLYVIGRPSIPVLETALANTNRADRAIITAIVANIAIKGNTNACMPILLTALQDADQDVRGKAQEAVLALSPQPLTNAPAN